MADLIVDRSELEECGPYPPERARILVFTAGNDFEAHGPALPADIDSRTIRALALRFTERTGTSFAAHIPYTTDRVGEIARDWSPAYIPYPEFKDKLIGFAGSVVRAWPELPSRIIIVLGHGGLLDLLGQAREVEATIKVPTRIVFPVVVGPSSVNLPEDFEARDTLFEILRRGEHAYIMEHSVAAYFGFMDRRKLEELNQMAKREPEEVLRRWPALAGLGGYLKFGGERYDALRELGLDFCADDFLARRKLPVSAEAGGVMVEAALQLLEKAALEN